MIALFKDDFKFAKSVKTILRTNRLIRLRTNSFILTLSKETNKNIYTHTQYTVPEWSPFNGAYLSDFNQMTPLCIHYDFIYVIKYSLISSKFINAN